MEKSLDGPLLKLCLAVVLSHQDGIDANHYDFSIIFTNFAPKLRCCGQQSTCYGFSIIASPEPFTI